MCASLRTTCSDHQGQFCSVFLLMTPQNGLGRINKKEELACPKFQLFFLRNRPSSKTRNPTCAIERGADCVGTGNQCGRRCSRPSEEFRRKIYAALREGREREGRKREGVRIAPRCERTNREKREREKEREIRYENEQGEAGRPASSCRHPSIRPSM